jgi:hypothetical protein
MASGLVNVTSDRFILIGQVDCCVFCSTARYFTLAFAMSSASSAAIAKRPCEQSTATESDTAVASFNRRVQPRHFHAGPNPVPGKDMLAAVEDDPTTSPPSTAARLYRHALESVFAFCSLRELASLLCVSKEWSNAVRSMRSLAVVIDCSSDESRLLLLCMSPLAAHVGTLKESSNITQSLAALHVLAFRLPHLHNLQYSMMGSWMPLIFPARLRTLSLRLQAKVDVFAPFSDKQHHDLNAAIRIVATLPLLEELTLAALGARSCCLAPLVQAPSLRSLHLRLTQHVFDQTAVTDALRDMPHLRSLVCRPSPAAMLRMLQSPRSMKLHTLHVYNKFTVECGEAVLQLPNLTDLDFYLGSTRTFSSICLICAASPWIWIAHTIFWCPTWIVS